MSALNLRAERLEHGNDAQQAGKSQITRLYEILKETMDSGFYGAVEIKFEAGKVTIIRKTESIKI